MVGWRIVCSQPCIRGACVAQIGVSIAHTRCVVCSSVACRVIDDSLFTVTLRRLLHIYGWRDIQHIHVVQCQVRRTMRMRSPELDDGRVYIRMAFVIPVRVTMCASTCAVAL